MSIGIIEPAKRLDDKGRCCGRKPLVYKREGRKFCSRCDRSFDIEDGEQITNWAWKRLPSGDFECQLNRKRTE